MRVAEHHSVDQLRELIKAERRAKIVRRLQVVLLAKQGLSAPQIAKLVPLSRRVIQSWVYLRISRSCRYHPTALNSTLSKIFGTTFAAMHGQIVLLMITYTFAPPPVRRGRNIASIQR